MLIISIICVIWGIVGYMVVMRAPIPKTKRGDIFQIIAGGPICWVAFPFVYFDLYIAEDEEDK